MISLVLFTTTFALLFFAVQAAMTFYFVAEFRSAKGIPLPDHDCPKVAAILCLRGKDPFLEDCLERLLAQDYPDYDVRIVIDHEDDPAHSAVRGFLQGKHSQKLQAGVLQHRRTSCSLKCSSLVETIGQLDDSIEVIALLDADTVPHESWLRELVAPLRDEQTGAATGNRWYVPASGSIGAMTRYLWNVFAIVQMYCFRIPWGGSLALKTSFLRDAKLPERWGQAFCEDTMLYGFLKDRRLRLAFVPSVLMTNREDCDIRDLFPWLQRQLLTVRLYHPLWPGVALHGILTAALPIVLGLGLIASIVMTDWGMVLSIAGIAMAYGLAMLLLLGAMEVQVRKIGAARGESLKWMNSPTLLKFLAVIPFLQVFYPATLAKAWRTRETEWRGIRYRIDGPWKIRRGDYAPFAPADEEKSNASL